jgi:hypothetical protein
MITFSTPKKASMFVCSGDDTEGQSYPVRVVAAMTQGAECMAHYGLWNIYTLYLL